MPGTNPPYPSGPFSREFAIGGAGGSNFISTAQTKASGTWELTGAVVDRLQIWTSSSCLTAIQLFYTDGSSSGLYGKKSGEAKIFDFLPGERITSLTLWGNGVGTRTGRVAFNTDKNRSYEHGKDISGQTGYPAPDLGSGILAGIVGRSGTEIDCLGFVFLERVQSVVITNVEYLTPPVGSDGISPLVLDTVSHYYDGTPSQTWSFGGEETRSETSTFTQSATMTFGTTATVSAGLPGIVNVERNFSWEISGTITQESSKTREHKLAWSREGVIQSEADEVKCTAIAQYGFLPSIPYISTVVVTLASGQSFSYRETGSYKSVSYTDVEVHVTRINA